jgi:general L-amino acid transport system substrate-binding protein
VSSENVDQMKAQSKDPVVKRLLGLEGDMGQNLGVGNDWAYNIVKKVGNYAEIYERNVGSRTPLKLERGFNALWKDGGLQYPMPAR